MEVSGPLPGRFIPGVTAPGTHRIGGWVGSIAEWTRWWGEKIPPLPLPGTERRSSSP